METKPLLMVTALQLFAAHGYDNVTINDVAHATGNTKGAVYHYFPSKKALYRAALAYIAAQLSRQALQALRSTPTLAALLKLSLMAGAGLLPMEGGLAPSDLHYLFLDGVRRFPDLQDDIQALYGQYLEQMTAMVAQRDARVDARATALQLLASMEGLSLLRSMAGPLATEADIDEIVSATLA